MHNCIIVLSCDAVLKDENYKNIICMNGETDGSYL